MNSVYYDRKIELMISIYKRMIFDIEHGVNLFQRHDNFYRKSDYAFTYIRSGIQKGYILLKMIKKMGITIEELESYVILDKLKR